MQTRERTLGVINEDEDKADNCILLKYGLLLEFIVFAEVFSAGQSTVFMTLVMRGFYHFNHKGKGRG